MANALYNTPQVEDNKVGYTCRPINCTCTRRFDKL